MRWWWFCLALVACGDQKPAMMMPDAANQVSLVGTWLSQGADVAPLLAADPYHITSISATFADNTYTATAVDSMNRMGMFSGTWTSHASSVPGIYEIELQQSQPSAIVSQGIYQIDSSVMPPRLKYEVAQTDPPLQGVTPPTAAGGFGSTNSGALGNQNVQQYVRQ
jgi:hypothetical protein